jgi:hypothetical protein
MVLSENQLRMGRPWGRPMVNGNLEWALDTLWSSRAIASAGVGKNPPRGIGCALGSLNLGSLVVTDHGSCPNLGPNWVKYVLVIVLGELCTALWQPLAGISSKGSATSGADNQNKGHRTMAWRRCQAPCEEKKL